MRVSLLGTLLLLRLAKAPSPTDDSCSSDDGGREQDACPASLPTDSPASEQPETVDREILRQRLKWWKVWPQDLAAQVAAVAKEGAPARPLNEVVIGTPALDALDLQTLPDSVVSQMHELIQTALPGGKLAHACSTSTPGQRVRVLQVMPCWRRRRRS